jgi:hypothetical protein
MTVFPVCDIDSTDTSIIHDNDELRTPTTQSVAPIIHHGVLCRQ